MGMKVICKFSDRAIICKVRIKFIPVSITAPDDGRNPQIVLFLYVGGWLQYQERYMVLGSADGSLGPQGLY